MPALLVFSKTTDYRHESTPAGVAAVVEIGAGLGFTVDATEDADVFDAVILSRYAAVVFLSTSGTIFETDAQRAALESYVIIGGGFVGIHAASTAESDWPFYGELVGGRFKSHPPVQPATVIVEDGSHPSTAHLGSSWTLADEWYEFTDDPRPRVHVLLSVDESTYEGGAMGPGHPIAWQHTVGAGRCFYTALGHPIEAYADATFREHLAGAIRSVV
jgi:type 1 glutamine amidotransferase